MNGFQSIQNISQKLFDLFLGQFVCEAFQVFVHASFVQELRDEKVRLCGLENLYKFEDILVV